jgi:tRNA nucleotidyltransferase (CCA-adding enzyme)
MIKVEPTKAEKEQFNKVTTEFLTLLNKSLIKAKAMLGGSGAKDTWLSTSFDVDVFVQFDYSLKSSNLSDILEKSLRQSFPKHNINRVHGSRDYFQLVYKKINFEVVPIIKISHADDAVNITDISPLHVEWVNKHTKKLKNDIRLAKLFFKANKLYGAESHISGLSGYVVEILVAYYNGFENMLKAMIKWKDKVILDPEKYYKNDEMVLFHIDNEKLKSPLILVDPVDKDRNTAAALSKEKFNKIKKLAQEYLENKSESYFKHKKINFKGGNEIIVEVVPLDGKKDIVGAKLLKCFNFLKKELKLFEIIEADWEWDNNCKFYFNFKTTELNKLIIRKGPPLEMKEHVQEFKKANKKTFEHKNHIMAKETRKETSLKNIIVMLVEDKYFTEKIKELDNVLISLS